MKTISPNDLSQPEFHRLLIGSVGPRPIAFASTVDAAGNVNLSPFSFFNVFGSNPPTLVFAPNLNRHGHKKHSLLNVEEVPEVVINVVNYAMVEQMSLASAEYDRSVDEFRKAGFTAVPSEKIKPPRVAESPAAYECLVKDIITIGEGPGSANLVVCEVILAHFEEAIFNEKGAIDPYRIDLVGRLGGEFYARAQGEALFEVARPQKGIGVDALPENIRNSTILSGNDLGKLGAVTALPGADEVQQYRESGVLGALFDEARNGCQYLPDLLHQRAKTLLAGNQVAEAWLVLLQIH
ncbi:flavin reductase family protein [Tellurirhabdus rosea]|uniref:flavin reductase family protein n=1 Tax=Tellurirhabdus rosea TaxID=2674997 RepID=UPI002257BFD2|nr:flavin reductase family protein [Tellurirhabdus rosea]